MSLDADALGSTRITLTYTDGEWVARDAQTGLTGRGSSREAALEALDETLAESGTEDNGAIPPTDPLFSGRGLFSDDESFDTADIDDVLSDGFRH
jgi:hypothetical protein